MTQKLFSRPYSIDIPQWQAQMDIIKVTFTVFWLVIFLSYCRHYGKSASSKNDCLDNCDKLLYGLLPICIICFNSSGLPIPFILWYINTHKLIGTHCCPAFCPNTITSP